MQNPLAALLMPTFPAEAAPVTSAVEGAEGSFADTFVETGSEPESEVRPEDVARPDSVVQLSWPVMVAPRSAFLVMADGVVHPDRDLCAETDLIAGSEVLHQMVGGDAPVLTSDPGPGEAIVDMAEPKEWVDVELTAVRGVGEFGSSTVMQPFASAGVTDELATGLETGFVRDLVQSVLEDPVPQVPTFTPVSKLGTDGDTQRTDGPKQTVKHPTGDENAARVAPTSGIQVHERDGAPPTNGYQTLVSGNSMLPEVPVPWSEHPTAKPQSDGDWSRLSEPDTLVATPRMMLVGQTDAEFVDPGTFKATLAPQAVSDVLEVGAQVPSDLSPVLTPSPSHNLVAGPMAIGSSFWERFFSDPAISAPDPDRASSADPSSPDAVLPLGKAVFALLPEASDTFASGASPTNPALQVDAAEDGPVKDIKFQLNSVEVPTTTATPAVDSIGISLADIVVADWGKDLPALGQAAELLPSLGLTASTKAPAGFPVPPLNHSALPVSLVASQLVDVLVRNPGTVTELALAPEELGHVRLRMEPDAVNPDRMLVLISVERPETLDLFRRHAGELAEAIRNAGYSGADIGFGQNGAEGSPEHRKESSPAEASLLVEEIGHVEPVRMMAAGTSLDLRL